MFTEKYNHLAEVVNNLVAKRDELMQNFMAPGVAQKVHEIEQALKVARAEEAVEYDLCFYGKHHGESLIIRTPEGDKVF